MKSRTFELRERATRILGLNRIYTKFELKKAYYRQIRLVHPDHGRKNISGIDSWELARLVIQAHNFLIGKKSITTMLENDYLVTMLIGEITPLKETIDNCICNLSRFYDDYSNSIWPYSLTEDRKLKYRFGGV